MNFLLFALEKMCGSSERNKQTKKNVKARAINHKEKKKM